MKNYYIINTSSLMKNKSNSLKDIFNFFIHHDIDYTIFMCKQIKEKFIFFDYLIVSNNEDMVLLKLRFPSMKTVTIFSNKKRYSTFYNIIDTYFIKRQLLSMPDHLQKQLESFINLEFNFK